MNVLIAGATGLIGHHLFEKCISDTEVTAVHILGRNLKRLSDDPKVKKHEVSFEGLDQL